MKVVIFLALVTLAASAPQPWQDFHELFEDFMDLIFELAEDKLILELLETYKHCDELNAAIGYIQTGNCNFKDLVLEMESLPEYQAVVDFLVAGNIDFKFFLDQFKEVLGTLSKRSLGLPARQASGNSFSSFIQDCIDVFPQEELDALFHEKMDTDEQFRDAIDKLFSDEWNTVFTALWDTPQFQQEVETLNSNGIDIHSVLREVIAIFGQNK